MAPVLDERFRRRFPKNPTVPGSVAQGDFYFGTIEERIDVPSLPVVFSLNDFRAVGEVVGDVASRILRTVERRAADESKDVLAVGGLQGLGVVGHADRKSTLWTPVTNAHIECRLLLEKHN